MESTTLSKSPWNRCGCRGEIPFMPSRRTRDNFHSGCNRRTSGDQLYEYAPNNRQVTDVHEVMHTMKTNLANIKNVLAAWDRPLMERKPKPVDRDEFERAHKAIKSSRYAEIKEGGKVTLEYVFCTLQKSLPVRKIKTSRHVGTLTSP